jgi:hypothetical protein
MAHKLYNMIVMDNPELSEMGQLLTQSIPHGLRNQEIAKAHPKEPTIHAPNVGHTLLQAYEQLRIASENIEDHLLFQSALKRFYKRSLSFSAFKPPEDLATELVIELTHAGYLENNTVTESSVKQLDRLIAAEYGSFWDMLKPDERLKREIAKKWVIESLSVKTEQLFNNPSNLLAFASFAYQHFVKLIDVKDYIVEGENVDPADHSVILYVAIHKSLLGSNDANVRNALYEMSAMNILSASDLIAFHIKYDRLAGLKTTAKISQVVNRNGAPMRILRSACYDRSVYPAGATIHNKPEMMELFSRKIDEEYERLRQNLKAGIIKSVLFLLITKALVGILIEIPYDLYVAGQIDALPLAINLLFPPLLIALTALTLKIPGKENKQAIVDYLSGQLYEPKALLSKLRPPRRVAKSRLFNLLYLLIFLVVFYFVAKGLAWLGFNFLQGIIFFVFLSTASFLSYRLALQIKELELVPTSDGFFGLLRDTVYAPFVFVGRRISYRFARLNIVAQVLDNVIELPLTTVLRLLRQWTAFLRNKQDEISG